jgi:hypothetical protein
MQTVFIYHKDGLVKALNHQDALDNHTKLVADGWKHVATINPAVWIENLCNSQPNLNAVKQLLKL